MATSKGLLWIALSGGVSIGVAAFLYATKNGRAIRKDIRRKRGLLMNKANEVINEGKDKALSFINEAKRHGDILSNAISKVPDNYLVPDKKIIRSYKRPN